MEYKSIVAIGRQYGSGGHEIGVKLAEMMGIPFYDRELIALAAEKSGVSAEVYASIDETAAHSFLYALSTGAYMFSNHFTTLTDLPLNDKLYVIQNNIINDIAKKGPCVIVGRCADYILRDDPNCVKVFIHAPIKKRAERIAQKENMTLTAAESKIIRIDKKRSNYYNFYTNHTWGDASHYDITFNSCCLSIDQNANMLLDYISQREKTL